MTTNIRNNEASYVKYWVAEKDVGNEQRETYVNFCTGVHLLFAIRKICGTLREVENGQHHEKKTKKNEKKRQLRTSWSRKPPLSPQPVHEALAIGNPVILKTKCDRFEIRE